MKREQFIDKFVPRVNFTGSCWVWTGARVGPTTRYAQWPNNRDFKETRVHRLSFMFWNGPIPKGMTVHHKCNNGLCVNPDHLCLKTRQENAALAHFSVEPKRCSRGHLIDGSNMSFHKSRTYPRCKICQRDYMRESRRRRSQ